MAETVPISVHKDSEIIGPTHHQRMRERVVRQ